jgi:hypothetical protein
LTLRDLDVLSGARTLSPQLREYIRAEVALRTRASHRRARKAMAAQEGTASEG